MSAFGIVVSSILILECAVLSFVLARGESSVLWSFTMLDGRVSTTNTALWLAFGVMFAFGLIVGRFIR